MSEKTSLELCHALVEGRAAALASLGVRIAPWTVPPALDISQNKTEVGKKAYLDYLIKQTLTS